ncbi:MAG: sterol desaturase family protein [Woeseiaceae bacterium]|jgi:hypothetical protein|nr:sterol desaturase family protein [Woeseiaceae bacterium]
MSASSVQIARNSFRERRIGPRYSGRLHLATTISVSVLVALVSAAQLDGVTPLEWLTIPLTFLYANLSEYLGHRGPMHHKTRFLTRLFERHSIEHHSFFTDKAATFDSSRDYKAVLFPPILLIFFIGAFAMPVGALLYWLISPNVCYLFVLTAVLYFLNYELLHFAYHADPASWIGRLPFMSRLRQHHVTHHNRKLMTRYNFNITYPICDLVFGTLYRD